MSPFDCVVARDTAHAVALLAEHGAGARLLAGGTDLLVELKSARRGPGVVIDISRIRDLRGIMLTDRGLRIGALATHDDIIRSPLVGRHCPMLAEAARTIGGVQTRNLGTLGGNLSSGVPSLDSGPGLVVLDAVVTVAGPRGMRELPITDFFVGPRRTALAPDELLVEVIVPGAALGKPAAFLKFGLRKGQALALVNVAATLRMQADGAVCREPRIALGAVAPTVVRALEAERHLEGRPLDDEAIAAAAALAAAATRPITDFRASADYRRHLAAVLTRRVLERARALALDARTEEPA
jgi:CO/xanthine dehydrogenase FAD-binding subunit